MPTSAPTNGRGAQVVTLGEIVSIHDSKRQGLAVSAIAREVGLDRETVRRHLERGMEPPVYGPRAPRPASIAIPHKRRDTVGEITTRRQTQPILCIVVEPVRVEVLFSSSLAPRCEQIFPQGFCSGDFANRSRRFLIHMGWTTLLTSLERTRHPQCRSPLRGRVRYTHIG